MIVIKRDGKEVKFSQKKIETVLRKAFKECGEKFDKNIFTRVLAEIWGEQIIEDENGDGILKDGDKKIRIEDIQDIIEKELMVGGHPKVAKAFILYREQHRVMREYVQEKEDFINNYKESGCTADATIDDNSNIKSKNIGVLNNEIHKKDNLEVSRGMVMRKFKQLFPTEDPKRYLRDLNHHIIYKHDESSFAGAIAPYCVSVTLYPFLLDGLKNIGGLSTAPKNLDSFCGMYINLIFAISSQFAGAVATSEFLLYFDYFARKEWGDEYYLHTDKTAKISLNNTRNIKNQIHQYFQQVVYSINQPAAARGMQSAFVNFSYFDKPFFEGMFGEFMFPDGTRPRWESLNWLQKEFMMWFNEERLRCVLTFPVESFAMVYKDGEFVDKDSARFVAQEYARGHSFFTYISDSVDSLSSCCFEGNEVINIYDKEGNMSSMTLEDFVNYNNPNINKDGNTNLKDEYYIDSYKLSGENEKTKITGTLKKEYTGMMYTFTTEDDRSITVTGDHELMVRDKDGIYMSLTAEDVARNFGLYKMVQTDHTTIIKSVNFTHVVNQTVYDIELQKNHYFAANDIVSHNCRLKNKVQSKEFNFTNGNMSIQTGSKSVITLNLSRIVQDWWDMEDNGEEDFVCINYESLKNYLREILRRVYKYHICYNELLWDMFDADLLTVYKAGFIDLNKQYLTIGINGLNEAAEYLRISPRENDEYKEFCQNIFGCIKEENQKHNGNFNGHKLTFNTECVPAESLAIKNYNWDKEDGYWVPENRNLYASYMFVPSDREVNISEKIRLHGNNFVGDYLDGGQACHINLSEHLTEEQYERILNYAIQEGCSYFTFNIPNTECKDCGFIAKSPFDKCPRCGSEKVIKWDRVIGYLTAIPSWSNGRREEQKTRVYTKKEDIDLG